MTFDNDSIMRELSSWSPHAERLTLSTLLSVNQNMSVINVGEGGLGKSRATIELLEQADIPFVKIAGRITAHEFFGVLRDGGRVVLDESAETLRDKTILDMLLSALWSGDVMWKTKYQNKKIKFQGTIMFNTNSLPRNAFMDALRDRVIFNEHEMTPQQIKEAMEKFQDYKPDEKKWVEIKKRAETRGAVLTEAEVRKIIEQIVSPHSFRELYRAKKIALFSKNFMGDLSLVKLFD